jgi:hypothetical protein
MSAIDNKEEKQQIKTPILQLCLKEVPKQEQNQGLVVWKQGKHFPETQMMVVTRTQQRKILKNTM